MSIGPLVDDVEGLRKQVADLERERREASVLLHQAVGLLRENVGDKQKTPNWRARAVDVIQRWKDTY